MSNRNAPLSILPLPCYVCIPNDSSHIGINLLSLNLASPIQKNTIDALEKPDKTGLTSIL